MFGLYPVCGHAHVTCFFLQSSYCGGDYCIVKIGQGKTTKLSCECHIGAYGGQGFISDSTVNSSSREEARRTDEWVSI